ncbi:MAG: PAS domain S-box protein [Chloroflexota bacterium]
MNTRLKLPSSASEMDVGNQILRYSFSVGSACVAFLINQLLSPLIENQSPFLLFFTAIILSAWWGGLRAGVLTTACVFVLSTYQLATAAVIQPGDLVQLGVFLLEGVLISGLVYHLRVTRKQTRESLQENQERFHIALENAKISVYTNDRNLRYTWIYNPHPGFTPASPLGKRDQDLLPYDNVSELIALKREVLASGKGHRKHIRTEINGAHYVVAVNVEPLRDQLGDVQGVIVATMDITEHEKTRAALLASEEKLRVALLNSPVMVAQVDTDLRYTWIYNPHPSFGQQVITGKRDDELSPGAGTDCLMDLKRRVLVTGTGDRERIAFDIDGEEVIYEVTAEPLRDADGHIIGVTTASLDVTEYERMQAALRESEELRRLALEAAGMGTWFNNLDGSFVSWDDQARRIFGVQPDEPATIEKGLSIIHPDDRSLAQRAFEQATRPGSDGHYEVEKRVIWPDGSVHWVETRGKCVPQNRGSGASQFSRLIGVVTDITERKRVEAALRQSEQKYRTLFNSIDAGFCICEMLFDENCQPYDYRFLEVNASFEVHTGLKDAQGRTALELVPDLESDWIQAYSRVALEGEPVRFVQGSEVMGRWFDVYAFRFGLPERYQFAILFNDITARKQSEDELRQQRKILAQLINSLPVMITIWEPDTQILYLNREFERLIGWSTEAAAAVDLMAQVYPDPEYRDMVREFMQSLTPGWRDFEVTARNGTIIDSSWANIELSDGRRVGIGIDIRERKLTEERGRLLQNLAAALSGGMTPQELAEIIIQKGISRLGAAGGTVALLTEDKQSLQIVGSLGYSGDVIEKWRTIPLDHPTAPIALAVRERRQLWLRSMTERQRIIPLTAGLSPQETHQSWAVLPFNINGELIGVIGLGFDMPHDFDANERNFLITLSDYFGHAMERAQLTEQIHQLAAFEERQRLSRELHDSVKQIIFASSTIAEALPDMWQRSPQQAEEYTEEINRLNRAALAEMKTLLLEMRPESIAQSPLNHLLQNLCQGLRGRKRMQTHFDYIGPDELLLPPDTHVALYRLTQEAFTNVAKHSQATRLAVTCTYDDRTFYLCIEDNGIGFDIQRASIGFGLNTMRERAESIGATFNIRSVVDEGTRVIVDLNLPSHGAYRPGSWPQKTE